LSATLTRLDCDDVVVAHNRLTSFSERNCTAAHFRIGEKSGRADTLMLLRRLTLRMRATYNCSRLADAAARVGDPEAACTDRFVPAGCTLTRDRIARSWQAMRATGSYPGLTRGEIHVNVSSDRPNGSAAQLRGRGPRAEVAAACCLPRIPLDSDARSACNMTPATLVFGRGASAPGRSRAATAAAAS
jgi:hypothetical protein